MLVARGSGHLEQFDRVTEHLLAKVRPAPATPAGRVKLASRARTARRAG